MANPIEHVKAKVAGITGGVEARVKGLRGVFAKLAEQHREVSSLLGALKGVDDHTRRAQLWLDVRRELVSHEQAEMLQVYPVLEDYEITRDIVQRHAEDATLLEAVVRELDRTGYQSDEWTSSLERLIALVKAHVELEEEELFPRAQEAMGDAAARELEVPFARAKQLAMEKLG